MRERFLPFTRPDITQVEVDAVVDSLRSGWITTGPKATEFEAAFSAFTGAPHAVAVCSATAGLHVVLHELGIGPGDEVITPAMTWVSTANLIVLAGATPVFVDVDRHHLMVTPEAVEAAITERTRLIVPVHFAGATVDLTPIRELARARSIHVVEDSAHAVGARYQGALVGAAGTGVFSFHAIKNLTTAEGGMIVTADDERAERYRRLKFHGLGLDTFERETQGRSPQAEVIEPGYKYNLPDISAAIGLSQLRRIDAINRRRRELAEYYLAELAAVEELLPLEVPDWVTAHAWHLMIVRLDDRKTSLRRDRLMAELKARNIGSGIHFRAIHLQKYYRERFGYLPGMLPHTEWNSDSMCSLPLFPAMTFDDVDDVIAALKDVLAS